MDIVENKLDTRRMLMDMAKEYSSYKFIGLYELPDDIYSKLIDYISNLCEEFSQKNITLSTDDHNLIFIALVEITKRWDKSCSQNEEDEKNSGFWTHIFKIITGDEFFVPKLYNLFTLIVKSQSGDQFVDNGKKYYATLMMLSLSPATSLYSFFNLCYNCFKKDLDYGFTIDDEWICEIVADEIRNVIGNGYKEDKAVSIGSSAYLIQIGLRSLAIKESMRAIYLDLISTTFQSIAKLYNREQLLNENRLNRLLNKWWNEILSADKSSTKSVERKRIPTVSKQNISIKFCRDYDQVLLCVPEIRIDNSDSQMMIKIYNDDKIVYDENLWTKKRELVTTTKPLELPIEDLLKGADSINLRATITDNGEVIFDSDRNKSTSLKREYIIFSDEKEIFSQFLRTADTFIYSKDVDTLQTTSEITTISRNFYCITPTAGESIVGIRKQVFFIDENNQSKIGNELCLIGQYDNVEWREEDISYAVYGKGVKLLIPHSLNLKSLELRIDNKSYKLSELAYENDNDRFYQFGLRTIGIVEDNYPINVALYSYEKQSLLFSRNVIVLPSLNCHFDKSLYFEERECIVEALDEKIVFGENDNEVQVPMALGSLFISVPRLRWRIVGKEWCHARSSRLLWYETAITQGDQLEIDIPHNKGMVMLIGKIGSKEYTIHQTTKGTFELGKFIYANPSQKEITIYCNVENEKFNLAKFSTKEHIQNNPVKYLNGNILWDIENEFVGDKNSEFFIELKAGNNRYRNTISNQNANLPYMGDDIYRVIVKLKEKGLFSTGGYTTIFEGTLMAGEFEKLRFRNKAIVLRKIRCNNTIFWHMPIYTYFIRDIEMVKENNDTYYVGTLCYIDKKNNVVVLDKLINECGEYDDINPVRIELRDYNTLWINAGWCGENDFIALFYDKLRKIICNIGEENQEYSQINICQYDEEYI